MVSQKVVKMEDTTMVKRKVVFVQKEEQTDGMKKREKFCERKENDERERGPERKRKELRQR